MDLSVYLILIMLDNPLVTIIDIPLVKQHVKKYVLEYPGYLQNTYIFQKKKIGSDSTFMTQKHVSQARIQCDFSDF